MFSLAIILEQSPASAPGKHQHDLFWCPHLPYFLHSDAFLMILFKISAHSFSCTPCLFPTHNSFLFLIASFSSQPSSVPVALVNTVSPHTLMNRLFVHPQMCPGLDVRCNSHLLTSQEKCFICFFSERIPPVDFELFEVMCFLFSPLAFSTGNCPTQ